MINQNESTNFDKPEVHNFEMPYERKEEVKTIGVFIASIAANLSAVAVGTGMAWSSPVAAKLLFHEPDSPLTEGISIRSYAWISSIIAIGAAITPFIAGPLADVIGRKKTLLSSALFFAGANLLLLFAFNVWMMLLGRLFVGFGIGFVMSVVPMYVGEISTDNVRGAVGSLMSLFIAIGVYAIMWIGPFVYYNTLQYFCIAVPIVFFAAFSLMPESPYYYVAKGQKPEALRALMFLRGQSAQAAERELSEIQTLVEASMAQKGSIMSLITDNANRKALLICLGLITFQQVSGINAVLFNASSILEIANMGLSGSTAAIVVITVQVVSAALTPFIADRFPRKTILLISSCLMGLGLGLLGCFFFIKIETKYGWLFNWLPVPALMLYIIMFVFGFGPLPWTILSEMFAPNVKPIASSLVASQCWIAGFLVALVSPHLLAIGAYFAFWLFSLLCIGAFFFSWIVVMETRGLSLQEIQNRLHRN